MAEILRREILLACPPERAFAVFVEHIDLWWPRGHRRFRDGALGFIGDRLVDRAADGTEWTMAAVLDRAPPTRLHLAWYPGSPNAPTDVEIAFAPEDDGTRIVIVHAPLTAAAAESWAARAATYGAGWEAVAAALTGFIARPAEAAGASHRTAQP